MKIEEYVVITNQDLRIFYLQKVLRGNSEDSNTRKNETTNGWWDNPREEWSSCSFFLLPLTEIQKREWKVAKRSKLQTFLKLAEKTLVGLHSLFGWARTVNEFEEEGDEWDKNPRCWAWTLPWRLDYAKLVFGKRPHYIPLSTKRWRLFSNLNSKPKIKLNFEIENFK